MAQMVSAGAANQFQSTQNYAAGASPAAIAVADFNGDGIADVAIGNLNGNTVSVFLGRGDGTFQAALISVAGEAPDSITVGDFNGDGKPDIAIAGPAGIYTMPGNGDGTFQPRCTPAARPLYCRRWLAISTAMARPISPSSS